MKGLNALSLSLFVHDLIQTAKNFTVLPFFPFCFVHIYNLFFYFFFLRYFIPQKMPVVIILISDSLHYLLLYLY